MTFQRSTLQHHLGMHHCLCCRKGVLVNVQMLFVSACRPSGMSRAIVTDAVHPSPCSGGRGFTPWSPFYDRIIDLFCQLSSCFCRVGMTVLDVARSAHSTVRATMLRNCSGRESSPASSPTRATTTLASSGVTASDVFAVVRVRVCRWRTPCFNLPRSMGAPDGVDDSWLLVWAVSRKRCHQNRISVKSDLREPPTRDKRWLPGVQTPKQSAVHGPDIG